MTNFNKILLLIIMFMAAMLFAQVATLPAGVSATQSVSDPSLCKPITGALYTLCPVVGGTADGLYLMAGTGAAKIFNVGAQTSGDYQLLINKPTTIGCGTSSQSNTGFTASQCTIK